MTSSGPRLHAPHPLLAELRKTPFRPILLEELRSLNPQVSPKPVHLAVSEAGYRTLYENTFAFTQRGDRTNLALFEVGFRFRPDGSIVPTTEFRRHNAIMRKLLSFGLDKALSEACQTWAARAEARGFDPNDERNWGYETNVWRSLLDTAGELEFRLTEKQQEVIQGSGGVLGFGYRDGFAFYYSTSDSTKVQRAAHSHSLSHSDIDSYFPSFGDFNSKILWAVIDYDFIKTVLADPIPQQEKVRRIIDHHVAGMKSAICVGVVMEQIGVITPILRSI